MIFSTLKNRLLGSPFFGNVFTLMMGTGIAQALTIAMSPILTRIFTPEDFGLLALYGALVATISVVATLRYELAIVQPKEEEDALALLLLSLLISSSLAIILFVVVFLFNNKIAQALNNPDIAPWLYLLPFSIVITGFYQAFNYFATRRQKYRAISTAQVSQSIGGVSSQLALGAVPVSGALILGQFIGVLIAVLVLIKKALPYGIGNLMQTSRQRLISNAKRYDKLPKFSALGAFADSASVQMPIFILTRFFASSATGMFSLTFRVLNLPMTLMSQALSQVFFQKIASMQHGSPHLIRVQFLKLFFILILMMVPFTMVIWFLGEPLFAFVFGEPWREAGNIAGVLVFAVAIRFPVSSLSAVLALEQNVKLGVLWQFIYLFTISSTLIYFSSQPLNTFLLAFTVHEVVLYTLYFIFILKGVSQIAKGV